MKTRINPLYAAGYIAGMRMAAATARSVSPAGEKSNIAHAIAKRATHDEMVLDKWRREGVVT